MGVFTDSNKYDYSPSL